MKTAYEVINIDLAHEFTKARKEAAVLELGLDQVLEAEVLAQIQDMDIPDDDDRFHWVQKIGVLAGVDLLTIGKVQPENMLLMAGLSDEDFAHAVKVATGRARKLNTATIEAEKELNEETIPNTVL